MTFESFIFQNQIESDIFKSNKIGVDYKKQLNIIMTIDMHGSHSFSINWQNSEQNS